MTKSKHSFTLTKRSAKIFAVFILFACGPGMADYDEFMSFFMPESTNASTQNQKYNYTSQFFYNNTEGEYALNGKEEQQPKLSLSDIENIEAWSNYCQGKVSKQDIREGVLGSIVGSKLESYFKSYKNQLAIDYLIFVQKTAPQTPDLESLDFVATKPSNPVNEIKILDQLFARAKHDFLKERIAFQLVKTYSIAKKYKESLTSFNNNIKQIKDKSFISDWALMRKAESEIALGDTSQAYYDFSRVFEKSESHKNQADLIVRSRINGFPASALSFCKNEHEKASLYAFGGIKPGIDALPMLEKIVEIDPKNQMIELIMAREINKNEKFYYKQMYSEYDDEETKKIVNTEQENANDYWSRLKGFSIKCAENQGLPKTGFWQIASAYMEYVQGDYEKSENFLNQAKNIKTTNEGLKNQVLLQELLLISKQSKQITPEIEVKFLSILESFAKPKNFRISNAILESCKIISAKYRGVSVIQKTENKGGWLSSCSKKKGGTSNTPHGVAKAYLLTMLTTYQNNSSQEYGNYESQGDMFAIEDTTSLATVEKVIAYFSDGNKTDFDKRLQKIVSFDSDHLFILMGRRAMDEANYAKAAEAFGKVSPSVWEKDEWKYFDEDPLYISTKYGVDKKNPNYTPYTFAKKMAELEVNLKANINDAESAYLLGCGTFNMTQKGNSWILKSHTWNSGIGLSEKELKNVKSFFLQATKTNNTELAAKAYFGAAICEREEFNSILSKEENSSNNPDETPEGFQVRMAKIREKNFSENFKILYSKYQNTKFQKQVLQECSDYSLFSGGKR
jgi:hypothetical protein